MNSWDEENEKMFSKWGTDKVDEMEAVHAPAIRFITNFLANRFLTTINHEKVQPTIRVLDVGTGSGHLFTRFLERHPAAINSMEFNGIDISRKMVEICNAKFAKFVEINVPGPEEKRKYQDRVHFHRGNVLDINQALGKFHVIISLESIYYISDLEQALRKLHGMLENNGILIVAMEFGIVMTDDEKTNQERISMMEKEISVDRIHLLKLTGYLAKLEEAGFVSIDVIDEDGFHYFITQKTIEKKSC